MAVLLSRGWTSAAEMATEDDQVLSSDLFKLRTKIKMSTDNRLIICFYVKRNKLKLIYDTKEACRPVWNQNRKRDRPPRSGGPGGPGGTTVEKEGPNRQVLCGNLFPRQCVSS